MLPGQLLWVESQQRLLTGEEALNFQGFPILKLLGKVGTLLPELTAQSLLHDLAGNAMALPVLLAMIQAALASMAWKKRALRPQLVDDGEEDDSKIRPRARLLAKPEAGYLQSLQAHRSATRSPRG